MKVKFRRVILDKKRSVKLGRWYRRRELPFAIGQGRLGTQSMYLRIFLGDLIAQALNPCIFEFFWEI